MLRETTTVSAMNIFKATQLPIVIVHRGRQGYVKACIKKAKLHNSNSEIILVGDASNSDLTPYHFNIDCKQSPIVKDVMSFRKIYAHNSGLSSRFERFCIERWLLVRNLMHHLNIDKCCAIDSDVLIFSDVEQAAREVPECAMSFGRWDNKMLLPHFNLIQDRKALESFCSFTMKLYEDKARLAHVAAINSASGGRPWVCDMLLFWLWSEKNPHFKLAIYDEQPSAYSYFDPSIGRTRGFTPSRFYFGITKKWKKLSFQEGKAYAHCTNRDQLLEMKFVHYHGIFKGLMARHALDKKDSIISLLIVLKAKLIYELSRPLRKRA